ncbi:MAG: hypothetical protein QOI65_748 [Thermoleophilaceae bacterium]|nr:hypothetical protein [Thermoleophilaceae bacterium]
MLVLHIQVVCYPYRRMTRSFLASLLVAAVLAVVPAAALAQDAGGTQYTDPLAGNPTTPANPTTPSAGPSAASPTSASTSSSGSSSSSSDTASKPGIPRTGFPAGWLALAGVISVGGGLALRRIAASTNA